LCRCGPSVNPLGGSGLSVHFEKVPSVPLVIIGTESVDPTVFATFMSTNTSATIGAFAVKLAPLIVTAVPPVVGPDVGVMLVTDGAVPAATYVKPPVSVPLWASALVTTIFTAPAACAGAVAVIVVLLTTVTPVAALPPRATVAP